MQHIELFEYFGEMFRVDKYFKDKINWNLFRYIQEASTIVTDNGYMIDIEIHFTNHMGDDFLIYEYCEYQDTQYNYEKWVHDSAKIIKENLDADYSEMFKIAYEVSIGFREADNDDQQVKLDEVKKIILNKFKNLKLRPIPDTFRKVFWLYHPLFNSEE